MTWSRLLTAVLLSGLGCLLAVGVAWRPGDEMRTSVDETHAAVPVADRVAPLAVLREWDRARAEAWQRGDAAALRRLYVPGSDAGRADRALLAAYAGRGLRVTGFRMQRGAVDVVAAQERRLVLVVTDRLARASIVGPGGRVSLPRDRWSRHRVVLQLAGGEWRVAEVRDQARPVASTDVTSRSENP